MKIFMSSSPSMSKSAADDQTESSLLTGKPESGVPVRSTAQM